MRIQVQQRQSGNRNSGWKFRTVTSNRIPLEVLPFAMELPTIPQFMIYEYLHDAFQVERPQEIETVAKVKAPTVESPTKAKSKRKTKTKKAAGKPKTQALPTKDWSAKTLSEVCVVANRLLRTSLPIVNKSVLIRSNHHDVTMITTDLDTTYRVGVPGYTGQVINHVLPAKTLKQRLTGLKDSLEIHAPEGSKYDLSVNGVNIKTMDAADYPAFSGVKTICGKVTMSLKSFIEDISQVIYAASSDDSRLNLNSVHINDGQIVATDGHRLAFRGKSRLAFGSVKVNIAKRGLQEVLKVWGKAQYLKAEKAKVAITVGQKNVEFRLVDGNETWVLSRIDGDYPDYSKAMRWADGCQFRVSKELLLRAIGTCMSTIPEKCPAIKIEVQETGLKFSSHDPDKGTAEDFIPFEHVGGISPDDVSEFRVNIHYLHELLSKIRSDDICFDVHPDNAPILFFEPGSGTADWSNFSELHLLMPMRD